MDKPALVEEFVIRGSRSTCDYSRTFSFWLSLISIYVKVEVISHMTSSSRDHASHLEVYVDHSLDLSSHVGKRKLISPKSTIPQIVDAILLGVNTGDSRVRCRRG